MKKDLKINSNVYEIRNYVLDLMIIRQFLVLVPHVSCN